MKKRTFWHRVQEAMRDQNMKPTQKNAAKLADVAQPSVAKWAKGGMPSMDTATLLAGKLHVCVEWLLTEQGQKNPLDAEASYLLDAFNRLPNQRLRDKALAYIDALVDRGPNPSGSELPTRVS